MRTTYTFAELEVPAELYDLVAKKLADAEYDHCFGVGVPVRLVRSHKGPSDLDLGPIDMHGIALTRGPVTPQSCPSGLAACELNRKPLSLELPRSSAYAIEDRDGTDAGLRCTAGGDDAGRDNDYEHGGSNKVARFPREVRRDSAPSMGRTEKPEVGYGANHFDAFWRMIDAEAAASPAPAVQDTLGSINFGGELRR